MFDVAWSDPETEELRAAFLKRIGPESARHLCKYVLHHHPVGRFADGFTEDDLGELLNRLTVGVIMLLHHSEITLDDMRLDLEVTAGGELQARPSSNAAGPAPTRKETSH